MATRDPRTLVAESIGNAIGELSEALAELEQMPNDEAMVEFVAHAMESYLTVTEGTLGLVERAISDHPNREVAEWIDGLRHLGTLMQHTVRRLLRASADAQFPLKPGHVNLTLLIERVCEHYRPLAAHKQLEIRYRPVPDVPPVWADRVAVAIVASNLVSNAVHFSEPHGEIAVQVMPGPGGAVCSVQHHGPALTFLEHARLFEGAKAPASIGTEGEPSLAHGLAIAKELVDRMGGRLWEESTRERGACFFFRLRYEPAQAATLTPQRRSQ